MTTLRSATRAVLGAGRLRAAVALAVGTLMLAGCAIPSGWTATVPTEGPIEQGEQVGLDQRDNFIRVIARGPQDGMSPEQVVRGFLDASASFEGDHAVARQFLTTKASTTWQPDGGVLVYEGNAQLAERGSTVVLSAVQAGTVSSIGTLEVADAGTEIYETFELERVSGQWRISALPDGLVLSESDVERAFRALSVYFFNPDFTTLVPDARLVPVLGPGQATTLIRMLLDGPSRWLAPAVRTAVPEGVELTVDAVPIETGVATVDLTNAARVTDDATRQAMSQQIVWTLRQLGDVRAVNITTSGVVLPVPGVVNPQPRDAWPAVDPSGLLPGAVAFALAEAELVRLAPEGPIVANASDASELIDVTIDRTAKEAAAVDAAGALWRGPIGDDKQLELIAPDAGMSAPVFDRSGRVWGVTSSGIVRSIGSDGDAYDIHVGGLPDGAVVRMIVPSRDGTRAALIVQGGTHSTLLLARIVRTGLKAVPRVTAPIRVESQLAEAFDVSWASADTLAVLGVEGTGSMQAFSIDIERGVVTTLGAPETPASITAAPGMPTLIANADGVIFQTDGSGWVQRAAGRSPAYPS